MHHCGSRCIQVQSHATPDSPRFCVRSLTRRLERPIDDRRTKREREMRTYVYRCRLCYHHHQRTGRVHVYARQKKTVFVSPFAPIQMASDRRTARKRSRSTTERVCEPIPAERVAHDAEIPDRTSYRYDTSSESSVSPPRLLTHPIPHPRRTDRPLANPFVPRPVPLRASRLYSRLKPVHVLRRIRCTPRFFLPRSATIACHRKPALRPNKMA